MVCSKVRSGIHQGKGKGKATSVKYKVERDERYLPYIELGRWLCSHFKLETSLNFHKPLTQKLYNLLDSLGSCESIYVYFKQKKRQKHELNHFKDNRNTILNLLSLHTGENKMARETKIQSFQCFISNKFTLYFNNVVI